VIIILQVNPIELVGLQEAVYVSRCLTEGQRTKEIEAAFRGDQQLVDMWILFLKHNHWIECSNGRWSLTARGRARAGQDDTNGDN
jgi:hypothetical protein